MPRMVVQMESKMKRYKKILETLKCPCGGDVSWTDDMRHVTITCVDCFSRTITDEWLIDALIAWLILTGGSIDGSVKPPTDERRELLCKGHWHWRWFWWTLENPPTKYMLNTAERTEPVLRPWLEEDIDGM